jgi:hypothetical protein
MSVVVDGITYTANPDGVTAYVSGRNDLLILPNSTIQASVTIGLNTCSVTRIADFAFQYCNVLTSITIPDSVISFGTRAFDTCPIATISFTPTSKLNSFGQSCFLGCYALTSITIPYLVLGIAREAFFQCNSLSTVVFCSRTMVDGFGANAFDGISPAATAYVPTGYNYQASLSNFATITTYTAALISSPVTPNSGVVSTLVTIIGSGFTAASTVYFGSIQSPSVTFVSAVEMTASVPTPVLAGTYNVTVYDSTVVVGGQSSTLIGAFTYLTPVTIDGIIYTANGDGLTAYVSGHDELLLLPMSTIQSPVTIGASSYLVTSIGILAFHNSAVLTSITIPDSVTIIGPAAFQSCNNLSIINLNPTSDLTIISQAAFAQTLLTSLSIPDAVTIIGISAFQSCYGLTTVTFTPTSLLNTISNQAFYDCIGLTAITIPQFVTSIGALAFFQCPLLETVIFNGPSITVDSTAFTGGISATATAYAPTVNNYLNTLTGFSKKTTYPSLVTNLSPSSGDVYAAVTITGSGLTFATSVLFGTVNTSFTIIDDTTITTSTPLQTVIGTYVVTVNVTNATGVYSPTSEYTYTAITTDVIVAGVEYATNDGITAYVGTSVDLLLAQITAIQALITIVAKSYSVTKVGRRAFKGSRVLTSITIPPTVAVIEEGAFQDITSLTTAVFVGNTPFANIGPSLLTISDLTTIGAQAFQGDILLTSITIPASVTAIEVEAFANDVLLSTVIFEGASIIIDLTAFTDISPTATAYAPTVNDYLVPLTGFLNKTIYPSLVTDVSPPIGDVNIPITITGEGFTFTTSVFFGTVSALFTIIDDTTITATSPMQDALGTYDVTVNVSNATGDYSPIGEYTYNALCLNHDTKILIWRLNGDEYVAIQDLRKGDIVKSYAQGYRKIDCIGKNKLINNPKMWLQSMWKMEKSANNVLIDDLYMLGGHALLVDNLSEEVKSRYKEYNWYNGVSPIIDGKLLLCAGLSGMCTQLDNTYIYTYYQLTLDNDGDDNRRFGIWANGVLVETPSKTQFNWIKWRDMDK